MATYHNYKTHVIKSTTFFDIKEKLKNIPMYIYTLKCIKT